MSTTTDNWHEVRAAACEKLPGEIVALVEECRRGPQPDSRLIAVLHRVQAHFGYLGVEQLGAVAQLMQIPSAKVAGVASFYHFFRLKPRGKHMINVCLGTACYVKGADRVAQRLIEELGIAWSETSSDGIFTLEGSRCLGTCGLAPVVMVDDEIYGNVTPDDVPILLEKYLKQARQESEGAKA